ncbi:MAG: hypothetical protein ACRCWR_02575 [Saezia sp.]
MKKKVTAILLVLVMTIFTAVSVLAEADNRDTLEDQRAIEISDSLYPAITAQQVVELDEYLDSINAEVTSEDILNPPPNVHYELRTNVTQPIEFTSENNTATIPIELVRVYDGNIKTADKKTKDLLNVSDDTNVLMGSSSNYVVGSAGVLQVRTERFMYSWSITLWAPATHVTGSVTTVDLTSGYSCGTFSFITFYGTRQVCSIAGHRYSASIYAKAWLIGVPIATNMSCPIVWYA